MNRTRLFSPSKVVYRARSFDEVFTPDNSAVESILDVGDDVLPNTLSLMKNPLYATALQDFAKSLPSSSRYGDMTEEQLFDSINSDKDLNNNFWSFIDASKEYQSLLNQE